MRALVPSKATNQRWIDSESKLETEQIESDDLVVTYKVGTTGDIPVANGFVELGQTLKHCFEVRDITHIPVIHGSTAIIVETNAKMSLC
jgi:hypothetical protein